MEKLNKLTLTLIMALTLISCYNPIKGQKNNGWKKENLEGKVRTSEMFMYKAEDSLGKIEKGESR
jgi:hypothetical protein